MKIQQKRVSTTPSVSGNQAIPLINSQQGSRGEEKNNFQIAVALLAAQKQKKVGNMPPSHKNSIPENGTNCQEQNSSFNNNHLVFQQIQNNNINQQNCNQATQKQNQSFNKGLSGQQHQQFHLPIANNINQQYQMNQQQNQGWNFSNSLNKSNILDTSYGNYMNQPAYSTSTQNQQHQLQQGNQFSGQKYSLKTSYIGQGAQQQSGLNNSNASCAATNIQQTRPSLAQQKLNQLLDQTKGGRQSPNQISATEQSVLTMNSSFNGNQKNYFNNSFQGQQQFNQAYNQIQNPSFTLPATNQTLKNSNAFNSSINNNNNNIGQVSHTLQDASPLRKTRQSLELRTRPLLTEGNVASGQGVNQNNLHAAPQYNSLINQQDQSIGSSNKNSGCYPQQSSSSSSNPAPQPHYMLQKPNQKPYAARIYKQNKTAILNKNEILNTSKDRSFGQQNQMLQTSLIESNRNNNNYLIGSGGKQKQNQQYLYLNQFNNNTQPAQINRNMTISPVSAANNQINKTDNYNKTNPALYNNSNSLSANYHPLNTFLNNNTTNNAQSGSAAQAFIQQVKDKINQNKKGKSSNSIGGNGSQNNSQILSSQYQQTSFINQGNLSITGAEINTNGIQNQTSQSQNQNSIKSPQANFLNTNNNIFQSNAAPPHPQPQYHHQKNSKSMTISKNSFIANFNVQSPIGNTTQVNLNSSKESTDYSFLNQNFNVLQAQISQSPSIHSIQKKHKIQINNLNQSNSNNQQQNSQSNPQQFLQQPRPQTQASSRREQETQKSNVSNPQRSNQQPQNQHGSASQLIDDQTNLSNITTNFITINENNKSSPKIYAKTYQDSFRFYDELLEDFIQKNKFSNERKLDYFDNFLITLNEIQRRTQVNQKLNFSQQQQQLNQQQNLQMQQNLLQISSSHNTAASLFQNSTQSSATYRFFENLKHILESPIQNLLQESRQQKLEFEQKKSQIVRELDLERKERAVLDLKIDILEKEKEKLQDLVTSLSKQCQQINNQKSRNQSTNSHTNSHNTSHNNTSSHNNTNFSNMNNLGGGFNLNQQEIQMLLSENEKLKNVAKKQRKQMNANRQKEEKLMKLLYAIRKLGINVDEIYNDNVKTPESLSPNGENQNRLQQKINDFISPEHNQLSQHQPWELSQDHNISQNTAKLNKNQGGQNQELNHNQGSNQKGSQPSSKRQGVNIHIQRQKKNKKDNEKPFYVNSQNEEDDENENQEIEEDDEYENNFSDSKDNSHGFVYDEDSDNYNDQEDDVHNNRENYNNKVSYKNQQYKKNVPDLQWNDDCASEDQQNLLASPKQVNAEMQYKMRFQKLSTKQHTEGAQINCNNNEFKEQQQQGRYSNSNNNNKYLEENECINQQNQNIQFIVNKDQSQSYHQKNYKMQEGQMNFNNNIQISNQQNSFQIQQQNFLKNNNFNQDTQFYQHEHIQSESCSPQQNYMEYQQHNDQQNNQYYQPPVHNNELDPLYSEKSVTDSESDVLSIPVNEVAYASQSNKMINAQMKDKLKINLGCLQVKDPANNNMNLNLGKLNGEGQQGQVVHEEIFGYHDEFMNKFDEFSQSWRDAINKEKQRYQNDMAPISHIYVSAL
ncbi:hypothetical protein TTHERM_00131370 (macronuclear) [Tetrahymena thermophila SB210]|uniref:Uncharacterized protein n=1 Tax=Tetrahymena thermophila (strain SB210) TaxID=312017 RepID=I7M258_TETTS|nr:hypothetical protein TTHERM_00131370 [Tetrahymena thermophila SB210]EAR99369.2 hypothetical protein TTHERM_00131370 [Tetrahymena thermophila SB210]|eukprot:XP_001019614.2 hypothetical protein TTHERM_00131370 [Tetrahymena thermophila SB210]